VETLLSLSRLPLIVFECERGQTGPEGKGRVRRRLNGKGLKKTKGEWVTGVLHLAWKRTLYKGLRGAKGGIRWGG